MLKSTGIIRRIDDLGRLIVPKELRMALHIREGDPVELCLLENDGKKFLTASPYSSMDSFPFPVRRILTVLAAKIRGQFDSIILCDAQRCEVYRNPPRFRASEVDAHGIFRTVQDSGRTCRGSIYEDTHYLAVPIRNDTEVAAALVLIADCEVAEQNVTTLEIAAAVIGSTL